MLMHLYIAVFENPISPETKAAAAALDSVYELSDRVLMLRDSAVDSPTTLRKVLQLGDEPEAVDAIFKLNGSYAGYNYKKLWNWLNESNGQS